MSAGRDKRRIGTRRPWEVPLAHTTLYPSTPPKALWAGIQREYHLIRDLVGFNDSLEHSLLAPLVHRYVQMVHLLPASQGHHHAYPGGLLRHGLEVVTKGLELGEGLLFTSSDDPPSLRYMLTPRWSIATVIAGFAHDLGKLEDVHIEVEGKVFQPHRRILSAWLAQYAPHGYELSWRTDRHGHHESRSLLYAEQLITPALREWILEPGTAPYTAVTDYLSGVGDSPLEKVLTDADRFSVKVDLNRSVRGPHSQAPGGLADITKNWVSEAVRTGPHPDVYADSSFCWIPWTAAVKGLGHVLAEAAGTPRDMDSMCKLLLQTGLLAEPPAAFDSNGQVPTWRISVEGSTTSINALAIPWAKLGISPSKPLVSVHPVGSFASAQPSTRELSGNRDGGAANQPIGDTAPASAAPPASPSTPAADAAAGQESTEADADRSTDPNGATYDWLETHGPIGYQLSHLVKQYSGSLIPPEWLQVKSGCVWLRWPDIWRAGEPKAALKALQDLNWIEPNPDAPLLETRKVDGVVWIVLKKAPSAKLIPLLNMDDKIAGKDAVSQTLVDKVRALVELHPEWRLKNGDVSPEGLKFLCEKLNITVWAVQSCFACIEKAKEQQQK